ncbi:MAG: capsule assembly Wzi family protein [Chitinophagaceae bacterium]
MRRFQVSGYLKDEGSYSIRPLFTSALPELTDSSSAELKELVGLLSRSLTRTYARGKGSFTVLPATINQQYNTHHPYGWNDGSMIQAKGFQTQISAGFFTRIGPLSVQIRPEFVYARNPGFEEFPAWQIDSLWTPYYFVLNRIDSPERFGNGSYTKVFGGQSSIRLNVKKLSLGVSTENIWWGPGVRNSLLMSNTAPGFPHLTFNTTAPVKTPIGSFEWQILSGMLKGSGVYPTDTNKTVNGVRLYEPKPEDSKRYMNGMIVSWQPKWTKGLFLGFSRMFYLYNADVEHSLDGYLPILGAFFKGHTTNEDLKRRDQLLSVFARLVLPKEKAEFYAEFGRNDHAQNFTDLLMEPEHARAYIIGGRKIFTSRNNTDVELMFEMTQTETSPTAWLRAQEGWYTHTQVRHGYTNRGQVLGAGIGSGSNSQVVGVSWIKGLKKLGFSLERVVRNNDFYYRAFQPLYNARYHWIDLSLNAYRNWYCNNFIFSANLSFVRSLNYQWRYQRDDQGKDIYHNVHNIHAAFSASYIF